MRVAFRNCRAKVWSKVDVNLVKEDQIWEWALSKLGTHKSMGPGEVHPQVLRELEDVITRPLKMKWAQTKT